MATAHFVGERYHEAAEWARRTLATRAIPAAYRLLAAALAHSGNLSAAREPIESLLSINHHLTAGAVRRTIFFKRPADLDRYVAGLQKAGLPE